MSDLNVAMSTSGLAGLEQDNRLTEVAEKKVITEAKSVTVEPEQGEAQEMSHEQVEHAVEEVNAFMQTMQRNLAFSVDEQLGKEIISVTDKESEEVIRQIPSEDLVVLLKKLDDVAGILFDTKV